MIESDTKPALMSTIQAEFAQCPQMAPGEHQPTRSSRQAAPTAALPASPMLQQAGAGVCAAARSTWLQAATTLAAAILL